MRKITLLLSFFCVLQLSAQSLLDLNVIGSYKSGIFDEGAMEILAYDPSSQKVFATNGNDKTVDIFDINDPTNIVKLDSIDLSPYGDGANSVDFHNGVLAVAVENDDFDQPGRAVFFDANGAYLKDVEVGVLPDMITFTPDGSKVLTANEGEPDDDYTADPYGGVSIIDVSGGISGLTQANVTNLDFTSFNNNYDPDVRNFGPVARFFEDFENTADSLNNLILVKAMGSVSWYYDDFSGDHFAEANAFSSDGPTEGWLIVPAQNLTGLDSAHFSFYSARNFSGGTFDVLISTDYDTASMSSPTMATWDTITNMFNLSPGGYQDTFSGRYSLDQYLEPMVSIAFAYTGAPGGGNSTLWQIDDIRLEGTRPELARNLEPEYIAVAPNSATAYVVCQENNAIAVVDLNAASITALVPLGFKDWSSGNNKLDASNKAASVDIRNWPLFGMYQPDAIKAFEDNGQVYIVSANEGDARDYDAYSEEERVEDLNLDPSAFPNAANLQMEDSLGRMNITTTLGDTDGDGDYDELYAYGARSFSVWNSAGQLVWDSEDQIAQNVFNDYPNEFNSNNDDNSSFKSRSDDKGTEPEAIEVAEIAGTRFAFIGLERMGGVMVYDITDPTNPSFVSYYLNRDFSKNADDIDAGDLAPEDLVFISKSESPNGRDLLVNANEVSGTLSIYQIGGAISLEEYSKEDLLQAYPNPVRAEVNFTRELTDGRLFDMNGREIMQIKGESANLEHLPKGIYTLEEGNVSLQIMKL